MPSDPSQPESALHQAGTGPRPIPPPGRRDIEDFEWEKPKGSSVGWRKQFVPEQAAFRQHQACKGATCPGATGH
ncbi:hypothetical protein JCM10213_003560 [Rhodosporidiobolus nylandii]